MRRLIVIVLGVLVLLALLLWWLFLTESGGRWVVSSVAGAIPELTVAESDGRLSDTLTLRGLSYREQDGLELRVERLRVTWTPASLLDATLQIDLLSAERGTLVLPLAKEESSPMVLPSRIAIPLALQLKRFEIMGLEIQQGDQARMVDHLIAAVRLDDDGLELRELDFASPEAALKLRGSIGANHPFPLDLHTDWHLNLPELSPTRGAGNIGGSLERVEIDQRMDLADGSRLHGSVSPDFDGENHTFDLRAEWNDLAVPVDKDTLHTRNAALVVQGGLEDYRFRLNSRLQMASYPSEFMLEADGGGSMDGLTIEQARIKGLGGEASAQGRLAWKPGIVVQSELELADLDPGAVLPEWPGRLSGALRIRADVAKETYELSLRQLRGHLRGHPLEGQAELSMRGTQVQARGVSLRSGDNRVKLDGQVMPHLAMGFDVQAGDLRQIAPGLSGRLHGNGHLSGEWSNPAVRLTLQGNELQVFETRISELSAQAKVDPQNAEQSHWQLLAKGVMHGELQLDRATIDGTGNVSRHSLQANAEGHAAQLSVKLAGALRDEQWMARIASLNLATSNLGEWALVSPAELRAAKNAFSLTRSCLEQARSNVCVAATQSKEGSLEVDADIRSLPLSLVKPWLAEEARLDGDLNGTLSAKRRLGRPWQARAALATTPGKLAYLSEGAPPLETIHRDGKLQLTIADDALEANFSLGLGDAGHLLADAQVAAELQGQRGLSGEVDFRLDDPRPLGALLPQLSQWGGPMNLRGRLGGTVAKPRLALQGGWREGQVRIADLGIELRGIDLQLDGDQEALEMRASAESGEGRVEVKGSMQFDGAPGWQLRMQVNGENFRAVQRSDLELSLSPELDIEVEQKQITVNGKVRVPYARIQPVGLPQGAHEVSPDEVIIGEAAAGEKQGSRGAVAQLKARLRLILGKDVQLNAFGLKSRLEGELDLHHGADTPLEGFGQLSLVEGRYKAYGQDLTIDQGRLLFAGPLEAASADVRAFRKSGGVVAGIWLTGLISEPETRLYSEPAMEEAEVLSYILTGGPMSGGQGVNAAMLTEAAIGLGLDKSGVITGQIAETLGVDEFKLSAGEDGVQGSSLAIGKQLSPDLQLRYLYGLFDDAASVQLRYTLSRRLRLEGSAGKSQSIDLIYEVEKD